MSELSVKELIEKLNAAARDEIKCRENGDTSDDWQDEASPENLLRVLAYVAELEREKLAMEAAALAMRDDMRKARNELESRRVRVEELRSFVTDADISALRRFCECCDDPESGGHDLEKEQVTRLEKIGALQRSGRISYITDFGDYLISITAGIECEVV